MATTETNYDFAVDVIVVTYFPNTNQEVSRKSVHFESSIEAIKWVERFNQGADSNFRAYVNSPMC